MKGKEKIGVVIFGIICAVIIGVCLIIQFVIKQEDKELQKESEKLETLTIKTESGIEIETEYSSFDNSKFYLKIPKSFKQLDYETITTKYNGNVPNIVFSNDETTINFVKKCNPDIGYCFGWSQLIGKDVLNIPSKGIIGNHPAELPYNRGRHPIIWALALGLESTASTFLL